MSNSYERYPGYRDPQIAWLDLVPAHWRADRAKHIFKRVQRGVRPADGVVTAFRDGEVTLRANRRTEGFTNAAKEIGYQGVRVGDLVVHAMDGFAGAIGVSDSDGKCSPVYSVCVPQRGAEVDVAYYGRLVRQLAVTDYITSLAKGIRERSTEFRYSEFAALTLPLPPLEEQTQIARFLDYETAKIDRLIEKQQQLIALLEEKRQAVISHAVTKGLNPDAPMKDSGIEWLGQVPAHWEVLSTSRVSDLTTGERDTQDARDEGKYPFFVRSQIVERIDTFSFDGEGVLTSGDGAGVGKTFHHVRGKFEFHQRVYLFFNFRRMLGRYFFYYLREHLAIVALAGNAKSTVDSLRRPMLRSFPVTLPPLDEQRRIVSHLEQATESLGRLIARAEEMIPALQERRTALISAAVTGKIDVRGWKPVEEVAEAQEVA